MLCDRIRTQEEINELLNEVSKEKDTFKFEEFIDICTTVSSDIFLAIMILLQNTIPCSRNLFLYKRNFEELENEEDPVMSSKVI